MDMGIREIIRRIETLKSRISDVPEKVNEVVLRNEEVLLSLNRDQMLLGRDAEGNVLTPSYLEDPYFDTPEQAEAYAGMKYRLESEHRSRIENPTIYPDKDRDTPNLIVTGPFQDNMFILVERDSFLLGSTYADTRDIDAKYGNRVFGMAPASREYFYKHFIRPALTKLLKER